MIEKRSHFVLTVKNLKKSKLWYDKVLGSLGFTIAFANKQHVYYQSKNFPYFLAIFQGHKEFFADKFDHYRVGFHHLGMGVGKKKIVDDLYKLLTKMKVNTDGKPRHYPDYGDELYYAVFFHDPDDLRLEVFYEEN